MVSAKDLVVLAATSAIFIVGEFASAAFQPIPGFIAFFLPTPFFGLFPVLFGIPGALSLGIGEFFGSAVSTGLALSWLINGVPGVICGFFLWLVVPAGYSEMKKLKHAVYIAIVSAINIALAVLLIFAFLIAFGFLPPALAYGIFWATMITNWPWGIPVILILYRILTPVLKRSGFYYGSFAEWRAARRAKAQTMQAAQSAQPSQPAS